MRRLVGTVRRHPSGVYACQRPDGSWAQTFDELYSYRVAFGGLFSYDEGKRIYLVDGVLQIENDEQRDRRLGPGSVTSR